MKTLDRLLPAVRKPPLPAPRGRRDVLVPEIVAPESREQFDCIVERVRVVEIERVYVARKVA